MVWKSYVSRISRFQNSPNNQCGLHFSFFPFLNENIQYDYSIQIQCMWKIDLVEKLVHHLNFVMDVENRWHFGHVSCGGRVFYNWVEERKGIFKDQIESIQFSSISSYSFIFSRLFSLYLDLPFDLFWQMESEWKQ